MDSFQVGSLHETGAKVRFLEKKRWVRVSFQCQPFFVVGGDENLMLNFERFLLLGLANIMTNGGGNL